MTSYNNARLIPYFKLVGACLVAVVLGRISGISPDTLQFLGEFMGATVVLAVSYLLVDMVWEMVWERLRSPDKTKAVQ